MKPRQREQKWFAPRGNRITVRPALPAQHECSVEIKPPYRGRVTFGRRFDKVDVNARIAAVIGLEQVAQKAGGQVGEQANFQVAFLGPPQRSRFHRCLADLIERLARAVQKALPRQSEVHPARMPDEQRDADLILKIPDAPADGRFLDLKSYPGLAEASVLGGRHEIAQMAQFDRGGKRRSHPGSGVLKSSWILIPKVMGRVESRIDGGTALATTPRDARYGDFLMRRLSRRLGAF